MAGADKVGRHHAAPVWTKRGSVAGSERPNFSMVSASVTVARTGNGSVDRQNRIDASPLG